MTEMMDIGANDQSYLLRTLSPKQRRVLTIFQDKAIITSKDVGDLFGFSARSARLRCSKLVKEGFLEIKDKSDKTRSYKLNSNFEKLIGSVKLKN